MLLLLVAGCATRSSPQRAWSIVNGDRLASLAYGRPGAVQADFAVICDIDAGVADLVYLVGRVDGIAQGARTELLIGYDDAMDSLPAEVGTATDGSGMTVVARTLIPPTPVTDWAGKQVTVGAVGRAATLTTPPKRRMIDAFLKACGTGRG